MILVYITFLVGIIYYILGREDSAKAFASFLFGCFLGLITCLILILISPKSLENSALVWIETARIYLEYYLIPIGIALPLFLLFSFSLSEETFLLTPAMLMGLLTIVFIDSTFTHRLEPESFKAEILLISFFIAVFLYELLIKLFLSLFSFSSVIAFLLSSILFLILCYPLALVLGSYHFTNAKISTAVIATSVLLLVIIPQRIVLFFK